MSAVEESRSRMGCRKSGGREQGERRWRGTWRGLGGSRLFLYDVESRQEIDILCEYPGGRRGTH